MRAGLVLALPAAEFTGVAPWVGLVSILESAISLSSLESSK